MANEDISYVIAVLEYSPHRKVECVYLGIWHWKEDKIANRFGVSILKEISVIQQGPQVFKHKKVK